MATRKIFCGRLTSGLSGSATNYISISALSVHNTLVEEPWLMTGTFRNLKIECVNAISAGKTRTVEVYVNGVASGLKCELSGAGSGAGVTFDSDIMNAAAVTENDLVQLRSTVTGGIGAASGGVRISVEFDGGPATDGVSMHGGTNGTTLGTGTTYFNPFTYSQQGGDPVVTPSSSEAVMPINGSITKYRVDLTTAPGVGKSRTFTLYKNDVAQDGSGGTPDTRIVISDTDVTGEAEFTLSFVPDDEIYGRHDTAGTPTNSGQHTIMLRVVSTTDGTSMLVYPNPGNSSTNTADYWYWPADVAWNVTEANIIANGPISDMTFRHLYVKFHTATQRSVTLRNPTGSDSSLQATTTGSNAQKIHNTTHEVIIGDADTWDWLDTNIAGGFMRIVFSHAVLTEAIPDDVPGMAAALWVTDVGLTDNGTAYHAFQRTRPISMGNIVHQFGVLASSMVALSAEGVSVVMRLIRDHGRKQKSDVFSLSPEGSETHVIRRSDKLTMRELKALQVEIADTSEPAGRWEIDHVAVKATGDQQS